MSDLKLISPLLDNYDMGDPISAHDGVRCCPAMAKDSDKKYIVKIISIPASQTQLEALLLTGAYSSKDAALAYFKELADGVEEEIQILQRLSQLEGFLPAHAWQTAQMDDDTGYNVYLLSTYKQTLERYFKREPMTHLGAINLGLDLCAALAVCRRAGYLYVDLKPGNVFVTDDRGYRIGDLGFIRLDSLKYASLPDKYRSAYTAPEISDAFAALNTTIDIYAVGLILYQAYNNGILPVHAEDGSIAPPEYADYEMAEIILKACAADPADRWQDPIQMGQALVSYMQRNGANDVPIVPAPVVIDEPPMEEILPDGGEPLAEELLEDAEAETLPENEEVPAEDIIAGEVVGSEEAADADDFENLSFLLDAVDEADPESLLSEVDGIEITDEVSEILNQAEALEDIEVPEPVVAPEPIEVPMPEPIVIEHEEELPQQEDDDAEEAAECTEEASEEADEEVQQAEEAPAEAKRKKNRWLPIVLGILAALLLAAACFLYYRNYYLLPINAITLDGNEDTLVVQVDSSVADGMLKVVCSNSHGNQITVPVVDGKATFENLVPNTAYNIRVIVDGFHKLTGKIATAYSTPAQTNIVQFSAVTGAEDGSVILGFTVDGPQEGGWSVVYSAEGEVTQTVSFPNHMVTLTGLTVGKEYTFKLLSDTQLYVTGTDEITFTASKLVYAKDLVIRSLLDGKLTAVWSAPEDTAVNSWTVRCYNESGYNETVITSETTAVFENLDQNDSYTVEVTAAGMSVSQRAYVAKNALTVDSFKADASDPAKLVLTWQTVQGQADGGWLLSYSVDGTDVQSSIACSSDRAEVPAVVPGATYTFTLQEADGTNVLAEPFVYKVPEAKTFNGYGISPDNMKFDLYKASPSLVYTNKFSPANKIYLLITLQKRTSSSQDQKTVLFAVRNEAGKVISCDSTTLVWSNMWEGGDCILVVPQTPAEAGSYCVSIYFDGQFVTEQSFTVS